MVSVTVSVAMHAHGCQWCGAEFYGRKRKYCSRSCRAEKDAAKKRCETYGAVVSMRKHLDFLSQEGLKRRKDEMRRKARAKLRTTMAGRRVRWREDMIRRNGSVHIYLAKQKRRDEAKDWKVMREKVRAAMLGAENAALAAWRHWMASAPTWWLDAYWSASPEPWKDPRLSGAEKYRLRYRIDSEFQLKERLRRQIRKRARRDGIAETIRSAFRRGGKSPMVEKILGYSITDLREHLERQFTRGMTWEKFLAGDIHIDHIVPQSAFNLADDEEWRRCWCMSNLRPMWAEQNLEKRNKIVYLL